MSYSVTKAAQIHLMKCLAQTQGPKVRVNAVLPGLLLTEWLDTFPDSFRINGTERAVMKKAVDVEDCADAYIMIAKNSSMTGDFIKVGKYLPL